MILIDFSHLSSRMVFVAVEQAKKNGYANKFTKDKKIDVSCYRNFYLHLLFSNIASVKKQFSDEYKEMILCIDDRNTWRKELYPEYKSKRKDTKQEAPFDYQQYYELLEETIGVLDSGFPFKVVKVDKAEGDDVVAILAKHSKEKTLLITEDKDYKQLLKYPLVTMYRPILREFVKLNKDELRQWRVEHIVGGDEGDGIPTIKTDTEFSPNFIKHLKENGIYETDVYKFNKLSISKKLYEDYDVLDKKGNKDIFKPARFGKAGFKDFSKDLRKNLKEKQIYWENYKRNRRLVMFNYIPKSIESDVLDVYNKAEIKYNPIKIMSYFQDNRLRKLSEQVQDFYIIGNEIKASKGMFDAWM